MTRYIFIFIFLFATKAQGQTVTNVYWTQETTMPANQTIYYNPAKPLVWDDFQGAPTLTGRVAAITMSGFGYKASSRSGNGKEEINISIYCYFSKPKSWVKPDKKNDYILSHEQHHFDISYLVATMFAEKLKQQNLSFQNVNTILPKIYKECTDLLDKMQDEYDGQTQNGQLKDEQMKWHKTLLSRLASVLH